MSRPYENVPQERLESVAQKVNEELSYRATVALIPEQVAALRVQVEVMGLDWASLTHDTIAELKTEKE